MMLKIFFLKNQLNFNLLNQLDIKYFFSFFLSLEKKNFFFFNQFIVENYLTTFSLYLGFFVIIVVYFLLITNIFSFSLVNFLCNFVFSKKIKISPA